MEGEACSVKDPAIKIIYRLALMLILFSCKRSVTHQLQINVALKAFAEIMRRNKRIRDRTAIDAPC